MSRKNKTERDLIHEIEELQARLKEAEETLGAIKNGEVDTIVVSNSLGTHVYSLTGAEHPYRIIVENMNEGAVSLTPEGTILYSNARFAEIIKSPLEKIIGASFCDLVSKRDKKRFSKLLKSSLKERSKERIVLDIGDNFFIPVYLSLSPLFMNDTLCLSMVITNLTEILKAESFAGTILDQTAEAIIVCDEKGIITRVNQAAQNLSCTDMQFQPFDAVFSLRYSEEDGKQAEPLSVFTISGKKTLRNIEVEFNREDGQSFNLILNAGLLTDIQNKSLGCVITLTDITARKKAEQALEIEQRRFFSLLNELPGYVSLQSRDYRIVYGNRYFENIFGESNGRQCHKVMHGHAMPCDDCPTSRVFETKSLVIWEWKSPDGRVFQIYDYPFVDIDGSPLVLELGIDISDRKRAEEALRVSENKYRLLIENLPQRIFYKDKNLVYVSCNENFAHDRHIKSDKIRGKTDYDLYPKELAEKYRTDDKRIMESGQVEDTEEKYIRDGQELIIRMVRTPIRDEQGDIIGILGTFLDITEKVLLQREAAQSRHLAALGELAAGVGHEINNPVTGVINCAQILFNKSMEGSRERDLATRIIKDGDRIARIVKSLLYFASPGVAKEKKTFINISAIVEDTLTLTGAQLRKDGIRLKLYIPKNLPEVFIYPQLIEQVFINIINNARYALNQKYPKSHDNKIIEISGEEVTIDKQPYVKITFHDYGIGIPSPVIDKIMNPFFTTKPTGKGTGLGLSISRNIINEHSGRLLIDSIEGKFTKVTIILPTKPGTSVNPSQ